MLPPPPALACSAGEEVTICYGTFPNEVFLLLFGFVPEGNPHDAAALFSSTQELLLHCQQQAQQRCPGLIAPQQWQQAEALLSGSDGADGSESEADDAAEQAAQQQLVAENLAAEDWEDEDGPAAGGTAGRPQQLAITGQGFTPELLQAFHEVATALQQAGVPLAAVQEALPVGPLVAARCQQLLQLLCSSLQEDEELLRQEQLCSSLRLAVQYRANKKRILAFAAQTLQGQQ